MRWFTADLHLGHARIIDYSRRPFRGPRQQTEVLGKRWNAVVAPNDEVWVLGDFVMGDGSDLPVAASWNGRVSLVPGNHDRVHPMHSASLVGQAREAFAGHGMGVLDPEVRLVIAGVETVVNHFPPEGDSRDRNRFDKWRPARSWGGGDPSRRGPWVLHGHVHTRWRQRGRWINVGVDAWAGRPVSEDTIARMIEAGPHDFDPLPW